MVIYNISHETGELSKILCLPVSGEYPKDVLMFPDNKHLVSLNHESNSMTFFRLDLEKGIIVMNGKGIKVDKPNCIIIHKLTNEQNEKKFINQDYILKKTTKMAQGSRFT